MGQGQLKRSSVSTPPLDELYSEFELSKTTVSRLAQLNVAFIRHVGPYESVTDTLWHRLEDGAKSKRLPHDLIFLGIAQDAPGVTPPERLRFDAAVVVPEPFSPKGAVGYQVLDPGEFAMTTHVGHYRTLPKAYASIVQRVVQLEKFRLGGLPAIEVYRTTRLVGGLNVYIGVMVALSHVTKMLAAYFGGKAALRDWQHAARICRGN